MALVGKDNAEKIWNYLTAQGLTKNGVAGLMGNLRAESGLNPRNLQNSFEKSLGMTDDTYTVAVDNGMYKNFVKDSAGYGLAQWTFWTRKQNLLAVAQKRAVSIGDLEMQLDFLMVELSSGYKAVLAVLMDGTKTLRDCSNAVLLQFEKPKNQSLSVQDLRASYAQEYLTRFTGSTTASTTPSTNAGNASNTASNTSGNTSTKLPIIKVDFGTNKSNPRTEKVSKITIHHMAGDLGAEACAKMHLTGSREASANYYIGSDGVICAGVAEDRRAWTSSSRWNDQRAITIEVANNSKAPEWKISSAAYLSLINLCADICKRYGITPKYDGTKNATLTEHRMFAQTECPGPYIHNLLQTGRIEEDIAALIKNGVSAVIRPNTDSQTGGGSSSGNTAAPSYQVGKTYTLQVELRVRTGPGTKYSAKAHSGLTADGQKHDVDNDGALDKGTKVTCLEIAKDGSDIWIKAPSGWLAAYYQGNVYIK